MLVRWRAAATAFGVTASMLACADGSGDQRGSLVSSASERPDEAPVVVNKVLPFRYPALLYARRVQGNVTLRLFIDTDCLVRPDSTRIDESSGLAALDSAALSGSQDLRFVPAKLHGEPISVVVLFPVYFRHPEAAPLPGDTILSAGPPTPRRAPDKP